MKNLAIYNNCTPYMVRRLKPVGSIIAVRLLSETVDNGGSLGGMFSSSYTYDRNSNVTSLIRTGYPTGQIWQSGSVDDLAMTYEGNRLVKVTDNAGEVLVEKSFDFYDGSDNATEYDYDDNGNLTEDRNRGITAISYNALNLPSRIDILGDRSAEYIYDASGRKLACLIKEAENYSTEALASPLPAVGSILPERNRTVSARHYIGTYEFSDSIFSRINTPYGYFTADGYTPYLYDYQGNIRNNANYYAFGLPTQGSNVSSTDPYLYGGKEFYSLKGINLYDFHARTYAPDIARFMQPDPKADNYHWLSPYTFCGGDPINYNDPSGRTITAVSNGITYIWKYTDNNGWGFYDLNGEIYNGNDIFMNNITNDLMILLSGTNGYNIVNSLVNRSSITIIANGSGLAHNSTGYIYQNNVGTVNMDYDDPVVTEFKSGTSNNTFVALGHELVHALLGKNQKGKWSFEVNGEIVEVNDSEKYATHYENMIRAEHGLELRSYYYYKNAQEKGGQLINPETRSSLFYSFPFSIGKYKIPYHYFRYLK